ncbi:hypothetical protein FFI89_017375 [Bradyrhizobium sp. KBS0727]|uniref:hypothetical protein n=1 Tax=unclassified Bradyrhizobium TaxID=2631580 RepID=UPI00110E2ABF|nr:MULTISPECIES: hypothetical protein [unclassified Bradyrhizobium]QDW38759.1 hypothetical protein FFI71_017370 [Bradyrhizobium sp. KBS0725]QDW45363.1 hypothetical protein FFI89_017375 [Bradyrhizobium sp. KBS0727]
MARADCVHSTPPTNTPADPTRRQFLSQSAGVAVGGAVLALATVSATADTAAPTAAVASGEPDPIFALIEDYRTAAAAVAAAASEVDRRDEMMIEQGLGPYPFISVLDASKPGKPTPTLAYSHEHIDRLLPPDRFSKANAEAKTALDVQTEREKAIAGDSEKVMNAAMDAEAEALDTLGRTSPTTIAGVLALLYLFPDLQRARIDDDQANALIISVIDALVDMHPNVRLPNPAGAV